MFLNKKVSSDELNTHSVRFKANQTTLEHFQILLALKLFLERQGLRPFSAALWTIRDWSEA